ncbi:hypothetical protein K437DRAFT_257515 [Tilletiaria anomala UBC 951]|uniref:DNA mismatch repair protein MSH3 n=1 Tax=Tilletiaria anomala (strain ATCC 24038 / CBS 436.72 / UBC 951) TaxID=1037660 RepID=A0A066VSQ6_TILAU|nr:uncharacterized protein K437DRAFT_257515 [Tilletiaria anomala UBC 951]KDN43308.1 hypothetical protein K437DRAFT_257515 [Tilletiaria anomala UBC 951]
MSSESPYVPVSDTLAMPFMQHSSFITRNQDMAPSNKFDERPSSPSLPALSERITRAETRVSPSQSLLHRQSTLVNDEQGSLDDSAQDVESAAHIELNTDGYDADGAQKKAEAPLGLVRSSSSFMSGPNRVPPSLKASLPLPAAPNGPANLTPRNPLKLPPHMHTLGSLPQTGRSMSRPQTGVSSCYMRPRTALTSYVEQDGLYLAAVLESQGIHREVGVAVVNQDTGVCVLTQLTDTPTYSKTIQHLRLHPPCRILVPTSTATASLFFQRPDQSTQYAGNNKSALVTALEDAFAMQVTPLARKYWKHEEGAKYLERVLADDVSDRVHPDLPSDSENTTIGISAKARRTEMSSTVGSNSRAAILTAVSARYYALAAISALFRYIEAFESRLLFAHSIRVRWQGLAGTLSIDFETARALELVQNATSTKASAHASLLGIMMPNKARCTPMTRRLLRMNILQPLTDAEILEARLDAIEELLEEDPSMRALDKALAPLRADELDIDQIAHRLVSQKGTQGPIAAANPNPAVTEMRIALVLKLKTWLRALSSVRIGLKSCQSALLTTIARFLELKELDEIAQKIEEVINPELSLEKGGMAKTNARVYAVQANQNPLLDVARQTYKENIQDILELCSSYSDQYDLPFVIKHTNGGAFILEVRSQECTPDDFPSDVFLNLVRFKNGKGYSMTTLELKKRNRRLKSSYEEVLLLSDAVIDELRNSIVKEVACLYKASEALAILDLIVMFADTAGTYNYTRPEFCSAFVIKGGRHPILDRTRAVPNDVYVSDSSRFQIITGPNMSGKSTYLRSIGLLTIMGLVGSYVPADYASFNSPDALLACLTVGENIEQNLSAFAAEMQNCASMLTLATDKSIILIDELGRGTSHQEGFGIVYSIAESLIQRKSTVFFATHFLDMASILNAQPTVTLKHLQVVVGNNEQSRSLTFKHKVVAGQAKSEHIALDLALTVGLPPELVARTRRYSEQLEALARKGEDDKERFQMIKRRKEIYKVVAQLKQIYDTSQLSEQELGEQLTYLQTQTVQNLHRTFVTDEEPSD